MKREREENAREKLSRRAFSKLTAGLLGTIYVTGGEAAYTLSRATYSSHEWGSIPEFRYDRLSHLARIPDIFRPYTIHMLGDSIEGQIDRVPGTRNATPYRDGRNPPGRSIITRMNEKYNLTGTKKWREDLRAVNNTGLASLWAQTKEFVPALANTDGQSHMAVISAIDLDAVINPQTREGLIRMLQFFFQPSTFDTLDQIYDSIPQLGAQLDRLLDYIDASNPDYKLKEVWLTTTPPLDNIDTIVVVFGFSQNGQPIIEQYSVPDSIKYWIKKYQDRVNNVKKEVAQKKRATFETQLLIANAGPRHTQHLGYSEYEAMTVDMAYRTFDENGNNLGLALFPEYKDEYKVLFTHE